MSDEHLAVLLDVFPSDKSITELIDFSNKVDELGAKWQKMKLTVQNEGRKVLLSVNAMMHGIKNLFESFGMALGPVGDAIMNIIGSIISAAIAMQAGFAAGGPLGWMMVGIAAASLAVAINAQMAAAAGIESAKQNAAESQAILSNMMGVLSPWRY